MWKRSKRFWYASPSRLSRRSPSMCSVRAAVFLLFLVPLGPLFSADPLTEEDVLEWARGASKEQVTTRLVEAVTLIERLDKSFKRLEENLKRAEEKLMSSARLFEESLQMKNIELDRLKRSGIKNLAAALGIGFVSGYLGNELIRTIR